MIDIPHKYTTRQAHGRFAHYKVTGTNKRGERFSLYTGQFQSAMRIDLFNGSVFGYKKITYERVLLKHVSS